MTSLSRLALLASLALTSVLAGCSDDSSIGGSPGAGGSGSAECKPGEQKAAPDGCNTCFCQTNGYYACTELACGGPGGSSGASGSSGTAGTSGSVCQPGEKKPAGDGCNTCTCSKGGTFECTLMACPTGPCDPQDAYGQGECAMAIGVKWDGQACVAIGGCSCVGKDCDAVYAPDSLATCQATHAKCPSTGGCKSDADCPQVNSPCAVSACVEGKCEIRQAPDCGNECKPGETKVAPDGCNTCTCQPEGYWACTEIACAQKCATVADCGAPPPDGCTKVSCENNLCVYSGVPGCGNACAPQDAVGYGNCDAYFGVAWNGQECVDVSGCSCKGSDCDSLSFDLDECKLKHADCGSSGSCQTDKDCGESCTTCNGTTLCVPGVCENGTCSLPSFPPCAPGVTPGSKCDKPGAEAPADDGCNSCICGDDFTWGCTKINCASDCDGPVPPCAPPPAGCDYVGGGCVNGNWTCGTLSCGGSCHTNADCPPIAQDGACMECWGINTCGHSYCDQSKGEVGQCAVVAPSCGDSCNPQEIKGQGDCLSFIGVRWNGQTCEAVGGCSCVGKDCGQIYQDKAICEAIHQGCVVPL